MTTSTIHISDKLHEILCINKQYLNLAGVYFRKEFNHCLLIIYYAGENSKEKVSIGYHTYHEYSMSDRKYVEASNSQVENTEAVLYFLGNSRILN